MPADASKEPMVSITEEPGRALPRLRMVLRGRVDGNAVADAFIRLYAERPEVTGFDRLFDLTHYRSGFELEHLHRIAPAYRAAARETGAPTRTAFVTHDPHFDLWTQSMGYQFTGRSFAAFEDFGDAERYLDVPLTERRDSAASARARHLRRTG